MELWRPHKAGLRAGDRRASFQSMDWRLGLDLTMSLARESVKLLLTG